MANEKLKNKRERDFVAQFWLKKAIKEGIMKDLINNQERIDILFRKFF